MTTYTTVKLGYSDPRTDAFGAHPLLGAALDLNDGATFTVVSPDGLELSAPEKTLVPTGNVRTQGERVTRAIYRRNRTAVLRLIFGPAANYAAFAASVRSLVRWLDAPPAVPVTIQWQPPSATAPVYLDVVGAAHGIPADEREWLRLQVERIEVVFVVRPGLRGDRVTLSNLVSNPGFEQGSGLGVTMFTDDFATLNAYAVFSGAAPSLAANVATLPGGTVLTFGSPAWGAINQWQVRFQLPNGGAVINPKFALHFADLNNWLGADIAGTTQFRIVHCISGTDYVQASASVTLTNATWYWLRLTQFPAAPNELPAIAATLYADSAGAVGAQIASLASTSYNTITALIGHAGVWSNNTNSMALGGAFANVNTVSLFGPGGWSFSVTNSTTGVCSGAWEQDTANTYNGGAATSFGAFRMDLAPAGTVSCFAYTWGGGPPAGTPAMPVAAGGDVLGGALWLRSSGLSATASTALRLYEYDSGGGFLYSTDLQVANGNVAAWTKLSGTVTTQPTTAYATLLVLVYDISGSNGATVWLDNAQVWNVTTTGVAAGAMPYCELRFPQSPAQLLVTGLLGDLPAPAHVAWGTYLASWALGATLTYALGRRAQASANARLAMPSIGFYGTALSPTATPTLDASAFGGYYPSVTANPGWNPRAFSLTPADAPGVYHLLTRFWTAQAVGNLANVSVRVTAEQKTGAWFGDTSGADAVGEYYGPYVAPLSASSTWTVVDAGQFSIPMLPVGALTDLTATYLTPRSQWADYTAGGSQCRSDWQMLLPVDGSLLMGLVNNPSNAHGAITAQWLWGYHDGLLVNRAAVGDAPAATYSVEAAPLAAPSRGAGGPGTQSTGVININSGADPYLTLDPTISCGTVAGVNQLAGYVADNAGAVLPLHVELQYSPLYLYPR